MNYELKGGTCRLLPVLFQDHGYKIKEAMIRNNIISVFTVVKISPYLK